MESGPSPIAGPSRPRRTPTTPMDLGDRIIATQRKNASATGPSRYVPLPLISEFLTNRSRAPQRRTQTPDEYSRGPSQPAKRALYDPTKTIPPPLPKIAFPLPTETTPRATPPILAPRIASPHRHRDPDVPGPSRRNNPRPESPARGPKPSRKLFDPAHHDPHAFSRPPSTSEEKSVRSENTIPKRAHLPRTAEEEADKERERRRRKEGSERGSGSSGRKKDGDGKSKGARSLGSRSSEGSESFKDRERGKGKR